MEVKLKIKRFNPERDSKSWWGEYTVPAEPTDRLLDALNYFKWYIDGTLSYRRSCAHGVCGSDAMQINGHNALTCKLLLRNLGNHITVEPLPAFPVLKDLIVDINRFFQINKNVKAYFITHSPPPEKERLQSPEKCKRYDDTTKCILCAACTSSCPSHWVNKDYVGPAAIVNAHRFIFDSRDEGAEERLKIMASVDGVWRCHTIFNCTEACPRGIQVTRAIGEVKKVLMLGRV